MVPRWLAPDRPITTTAAQDDSAAEMRVVVVAR